MKPILILLLLLVPQFLSAEDHLLISEVMIPASTEAQNAFIELYNPTAQAIALNQVYLANYNSYYRMVNTEYSTNSAHFLVRFPDTVIESKQVLVVALQGQAYFNRFGKKADFEIISTDAETPDLEPLYLGGNPLLEFSRGMVIAFTWDGNNDLVQDIDYMPWGITAFSSFWMDKSGVAIDGPDADSDPSTYQDDWTKSQQKARSAPTGGLSLQRLSITEIDEVQSGGNGISGHNEATENWQASFTAAEPTPGSFSENPGDGTGLATITPDTLLASGTADVTLGLIGNSDYAIQSVQITVDDAWSWSQSLSDVTLDGAGLSSATAALEGNILTLQNCQITRSDGAEISFNNLTAPNQAGMLRFAIRTAAAGGQLTEIGVFPGAHIIAPLTIAEIQDNFTDYNGKTVTISGVVTIGAGVTRTDHTDAFIQDESGRGINLFFFDKIFADVQRGNRLRVTGTVSEFQGSTQIGNFTVELLSTGNSIPGIRRLNTQQSGNLDLEGTMIETAGIINDIFAVGGGTNITINDGSGNIQMRIWDVSGVNLSALSLGDTLGVRGVIDIYNNNPQLLVAYQEDIFPGEILETADGSGLASVEPDTVALSQNVALTFTLRGTTVEPITELSINVPSYWSWSSSPAEVTLGGALSNAALNVSNRLITLSNFTLDKEESASLVISNLTAPAVDSISVFTVKTAGSQGSLREIKYSPRVIVGKGTNISTISIAEARKLPEGTIVTVKGVVIIGIGPLRSDRTDTYIQDESGAGINVFSFTVDPRLERGNQVIVRGKLTPFQGKLEITDYTLTLLNTNVALPEPNLVTTYEASTILYEGGYVQVRGVITRRSSSGGGTSIYVDDGSGECTLRIWDTANLNLDDFQQNEFIIASGIASIWNNAGQILIAYQEDLAKPTFEGAPVELKVMARPFVPDKGEKIPIEFSAGAENTQVTLRIFDMGGRLVTTLVDGAGLPFLLRKDWNGRDHLGELVPLGTYICHLQVVNKDTGKRSEKIAPIVVGTVLK